MNLLEKDIRNWDSFRHILMRLRYDITGWLSKHTALYIPLVRLYSKVAPIPGHPVTRSTEIVIEGFPRSANTFATVAFQNAQDRLVRIGHHVQAAAQVNLAEKWRIPIIVLIREPDVALLSYIIFNQFAWINQVFREYVRFYWYIEPLHKRFENIR